MTEPTRSTHAVKNTGRGPRFVTNADGRQVMIEKGQTLNIAMTAGELKSTKAHPDLEVGKPLKGAAGKAPETGQTGPDGLVHAPSIVPGEGEGEGGEGEGEGEGSDDGEPVAAYIAHEGLGRWYRYDAEDNKFGDAMSKEDAKTAATDGKIEYRGAA